MLVVSSFAILSLFYSSGYCQYGINTCNCGGLQGFGGLSSKIVNGQVVRSNRMPYPWLARVVLRGTPVCGASILNQKFVITAAHCTRNTFGRHQSDPLGPPSDFKVLIFPSGISDWCQQIQNNQSLLEVIQIYDHPNFTVKGDNVFYDVSLLELNQFLVFNRTFYPVCLFTSALDGNSPVLVAGWGTSNLTIKESKNCRLSKGILSLIPQTDLLCMRSKSQIIDDPLGDPRICGLGAISNQFAEFGRVDSCRGDSGGPIVLHQQWPTSPDWGGPNQGTLVKGYRFFIVGIVSYGATMCGGQTPGIYTPLYHPRIKNWIQSILAKGQCIPAACHIYNAPINNVNCTVDGYWNEIMHKIMMY